MREPAVLRGRGRPRRCVTRTRRRGNFAQDGRTRTYFLRRAPARFAARKDIAARIAFCCTAAAVRPSFLAT